MTEKERKELEQKQKEAEKKKKDLEEQKQKELEERRKKEARELRKIEEKEDSEFQNEIMGNFAHEESHRPRRHPIWNGFKFLGNSLASQWRVLLTITVIFLSIIFILAALTFGFDRLTPGNNFNIHDGIWSGKDPHITMMESVWWVFITISTIGYGDIYPTTQIMKIWAMLIGVVGIIFVSLYTAVVVNGFAIEMQKNLEKRRARMETINGTKKIDPQTKIKNLKQEIKLKDDEIKGLMIAIASLSGKSSTEIRKSINESIEAFKATEEKVKKDQTQKGTKQK